MEIFPQKGPEIDRLEEDRKKKKYWRRWGPYLTLREWGTVREDYSTNGDAWRYFPFEHAHLRTYRWGEDGIAGISDNHQRICFAWAFWNGKDPILKERFFGLANGEGNHGEDVKECYYYLDNVPSHAYMKMLYKYPTASFPYQELREENRTRTTQDPEFEIYNTPIFQERKYFDIWMEYAKAEDEDIIIKICVHNRDRQKQELYILPTFWFRNVWSWDNSEKKMKLENQGKKIKATYPDFGPYYLHLEKETELLFTENETNFKELYNQENISSYTKDGIGRYVIGKEKKAVNNKSGTKAAACYHVELAPDEQQTFYLRLTNKEKVSFEKIEDIFSKRIKEADDFYTHICSEKITKDQYNIQRQAFAGLLWNKQFYHYVVEEWLQGDKGNIPPAEERLYGRNARWKHLYNNDVLSMPDTWEYPWFASWDTAFHTLPIALIDPDFAKKQLTLLTREWYMHPNGQIPAYEWNFSDVNPPVHAWAGWRVYKMEAKWHNKEDHHFLASLFQKLLLNFTWWVNRKDQSGRNVFEGGFLGLDNISIFNRSEHLPLGGSLTQADATSWMGMYCLNMLAIAFELAEHDPSYEDMASKFFEHFLYIAHAINYDHSGMPTLWNEEDGFYYDIMHLPDNVHIPIKVRSIAGLIPLFAVETISHETLEKFGEFKRRFNWFLDNRKKLCEEVACMYELGEKNRHILSFLNDKRLKKVLSIMLDEKEFLSPFGIRSLSFYHKENPYRLDIHGMHYSIAYEPGESASGLYGGNSNWRGPIWFPLNFLIIESLQKFHHYFGDEFKVEFPTGSGNMLTLWDVAGELAKRLISLFESKDNQRIFLKDELFSREDFHNYLHFFEYFHADSGKGLGSSHQTGWTGLIAKLIQQYGYYATHD